jgi:membrane protein DedA with SNARE-associated domain
MSLEQLQSFIAQYGYGAIFAMLMLGIVGLPIPDETLLTLTGYLVFRGTLSPVPTYVATLLGTVCGITLSYGIGRFGGIRLLRRYGHHLHLTPERITRVNRWFRRRGKWSLAIGYFIPAVRHVIAVVAGSSGLQLKHFVIFAYPGAAVWAAVFLYAGFALGEGWERFPKLMRIVAVAAVVIGVTLVAVFVLVRKRWRRVR